MEFKRVRFSNFYGAIIILLTVWSSLSLTFPAFHSADLPVTTFDFSNKIKGVHFFFHRRGGVVELDPLVKNHVGQLVLVPYGYQSSYNDPVVQFNRRRGRSSHGRDSSYLRLSEQARSMGLDIVVKPHLWMQHSEGKWRSDIEFEHEVDWDLWMETYTSFILHYAKLSEEIGASHFCIGTELASATRIKSEYWRELIQQVRDVYSGKVFYAANWYKEYEQIDFWDELDLIGVQAYFPVSKSKQPSITDICKSWRPHMQRLVKISEQYDRPILFSELGYKSTMDAAIAPWEWLNHEDNYADEICMETQASCYEAFFRTFWNKPWFAGALLWQWRGNHVRAGGVENPDFTPQNKPAQEVISKWFSKK